MPTGSAATVPVEARPLVDQAKADVSQRLSISTAEVRLVSVDAVVWPSPQLSCGGAQLDDSTPTPGFRIMLQAQGQEWEYHTNMKRAVWCDPRRP